MKEIELTQGFIVKVDDQDYGLLSKYKWYAGKCNSKVYARRSKTVGGSRTTVSMHREIFKLTTKDRAQVDHINGDTLDNRRENLRLVDDSQQKQNQFLSSKNTSGFKGVRLDKRRGKWVAQIRHKGKYQWLGYFENKLDAARAYNEAATDLFGDHAKLNQIECAHCLKLTKMLERAKEQVYFSFEVGSDLQDAVIRSRNRPSDMGRALVDEGKKALKDIEDINDD